MAGYEVFHEGSEPVCGLVLSKQAWPFARGFVSKESQCVRQGR